MMRRGWGGRDKATDVRREKNEAEAHPKTNGRHASLAAAVLLTLPLTRRVWLEM